MECIAGNYDVAIGRGDPDCGCGYSDERDNQYAQIIYDHTRAHTSPEFAAWMRELALEHRETIGGIDVHMVHGSPLAINDFLWESLHDDELGMPRRCQWCRAAALHPHQHPMAAAPGRHVGRQRRRRRTGPTTGGARPGTP